ncbi:MAG: hypothetical protein AAF430_18505 [Myxococcota bacterium]
MSGLDDPLVLYDCSFRCFQRLEEQLRVGERAEVTFSSDLLSANIWRIQNDQGEVLGIAEVESRMRRRFKWVAAAFGFTVASAIGY